MTRCTFFILAIFLACQGMAQSVLYNESFTGQQDKGAIGTGTTTPISIDTSGVTWSVDTTNVALTASTDWMKVVSDTFMFKDIDGLGKWSSPFFSIKNFTNLSLSVFFKQNGDLESSDILEAYVQIDTNTAVLIAGVNDDFGTFTLSDSSVSGTGDSMRVIIHGNCNVGEEELQFDNVVVKGDYNSPCTSPTTSPTGLTTTASDTNSISIEWTKGNGDRSLVVFHELNGLTSAPLSGTHYAADTSFASGDDINSGNWVVYNDTGNTATISGLTRNTSYVALVYTYFDSDTCYSTTALRDTVLTACGTPNKTTNLSAMQHETSVDLSWSNPTCFDEIMVVAKAGTSISGAPSGDGTSYTADTAFSGTGTAFDGGKVVYKGTGSTVTVTQLTNNTKYYVAVFARSGTTWSAASNIIVAATNHHIIISEITDPSDNTSARYVELFNAGTSAVNLGSFNYEVAKQTNGGNWSSTALTGTINPGETHTIAVSSSGYNTAFGEIAEQSYGNFNGNGDDGYYLFFEGDEATGALIDAFGEIDVDGTGQTWEYEDSRAVRDTSISTPSRSFNDAEWTISSSTAASCTPGSHHSIHPQLLITTSQNISEGSYYSITVNGASAVGTLQGNTVVKNTLNLTNGTIDLQGDTLFIGDESNDGAVTGGDANSYVSNGTLSSYVNSASGTYNFPIGTSDYTPVSVTFTSATLATNAFLSVSVADSAHVQFDTTVTEYIDRSWIVEPNGISNANYSIQLTYLDGDVVGGNEPGLYPVKYSGGQWFGPTGTNADSIIGSASVQTTTNTLSWNGLTSFSIFGGAGSGAPLPMELGDVQLVEENENLIIRWFTLSEINTSQFAVQRRTNQQDFETIAYKKAAGFSNTMREYAQSIKKPRETSYFRLILSDKDGTTTYSDIITYTHSKDVTQNNLRFSAENLTLSIAIPEAQEPTKVHVYTISGSKIATHTFDSTFSCTVPAKGVYIVQLSTGAETSIHKVFVD